MNSKSIEVKNENIIMNNSEENIIKAKSGKIIKEDKRSLLQRKRKRPRYIEKDEVINRNNLKIIKHNNIEYYPIKYERNMMEGQTRRKNYYCDKHEEIQYLGQMEAVGRHYADVHPKLLPNLKNVIGLRDFLTFRCRVFINRLLKCPEQFDPNYDGNSRKILTEMVFDSKTVNYINNWIAGEYNGKFCSCYSCVPKDVLNQYLELCEDHIKNFKNCINNMNYEYCGGNEKQDSLKNIKLENFAELDLLKCEHKEAYFFIAFMDKTDKNNDNELNIMPKLNIQNKGSYKHINNKNKVIEDDEVEKLNNENINNQSIIKLNEINISNEIKYNNGFWSPIADKNSLNNMKNLLPKNNLNIININDTPNFDSKDNINISNNMCMFNKIRKDRSKSNHIKKNVIKKIYLNKMNINLNKDNNEKDKYNDIKKECISLNENDNITPELNDDKSNKNINKNMNKKLDNTNKKNESNIQNIKSSDNKEIQMSQNNIQNNKPENSNLSNYRRKSPVIKLNKNEDVLFKIENNLNVKKDDKTNKEDSCLKIDNKNEKNIKMENLKEQNENIENSNELKKNKEKSINGSIIQDSPSSKSVELTYKDLGDILRSFNAEKNKDKNIIINSNIMNNKEKIDVKEIELIDKKEEILNSQNVENKMNNLLLTQSNPTKENIQLNDMINNINNKIYDSNNLNSNSNSLNKQHILESYEENISIKSDLISNIPKDKAEHNFFESLNNSSMKLNNDKINLNLLNDSPNDNIKDGKNICKENITVNGKK